MGAQETVDWMLDEGAGDAGRSLDRDREIESGRRGRLLVRIHALRNEWDLIRVIRATLRDGIIIIIDKRWLIWSIPVCKTFL